MQTFDFAALDGLGTFPAHDQRPVLVDQMRGRKIWVDVITADTLESEVAVSEMNEF